MWTSRNKPVDRATIARVEQAWQVRFPDQYVTLAMAFDGGHPDPDAVTLFDGALVHFAQLACYERDSQNHIVRLWAAHFERLPARVFPFAEDGGGNPFVFDFRNPTVPPPVWWYDHEYLNSDGLFDGVQVAPDFAGFLSRLQTDRLAAEE